MKIENLTKEQESIMTIVRDKWINRFNSIPKINNQKAIEFVEFIYEISKLKKPEIIFMPSPMAAQKYLSLCKNKSTIEYESFAWYGNIGDYGWISFYDYFTKIGILNNEIFNKYSELLFESAIYDLMLYENACIVIEMPIKIKRNSTQELHEISDMAIKWSDNYGQHYINGRHIPEKYFLAISENIFTMKDFINENNEEYKSSCIALMQETYGDEYLVNFFRQNLKETDTYVDKKDHQFLEGTTRGMNIGVYTLFKGKINNENIAFVRCYCPSTDRMFFLGVESVHNNAKDAIASLYRIPSKLKTHIQSISRQGERFSTILSDQGNEILKSLSETEISEVTNLPGDKYFSLMKYEY